jgi:hypothetical protein
VKLRLEDKRKKNKMDRTTGLHQDSRITPRMDILAIIENITPLFPGLRVVFIPDFAENNDKPFVTFSLDKEVYIENDFTMLERVKIQLENEMTTVINNFKSKFKEKVGKICPLTFQYFSHISQIVGANSRYKFTVNACYQITKDIKIDKEIENGFVEFGEDIVIKTPLDKNLKDYKNNERPSKI